MRYLRENQYYIVRYDLQTIKECLRWYWGMVDGFEVNRNSEKFKKFTKEKFDNEVNKAASFTTNAIAIERFRHRARFIKEWMDSDRKIQEKYDNAKPPEDIYCKECFSRTKITSKDLLNSSDENSNVLFMFECVKCKKVQALYENGSEWHYDPVKCPKCNCPMNHDSKLIKDILTTNYLCSSCSYKEQSVHDFKKSNEETKRREARDQKLLEVYRDRFCLNGEAGVDAVRCADDVSRLVKEWKEQEKKDKDPVYQKAKQLKKLKIGQLKELLEKTIEKEDFKDLTFAKPEIGQYVIVEFSVNDMKDERGEYDSQNTLKKLIKTVLEDSNWRLMSDGIHYRLGILTGKLKAFEHEDDLVRLITE